MRGNAIERPLLPFGANLRPFPCAGVWEEVSERLSNVRVLLLCCSPKEQLDVLPVDQLDGIGILSISKTTLLKLSKLKKFPPPVKLSEGVTADA